jgi:putative peptidoglycan lipid II flippase
VWSPSALRGGRTVGTVSILTLAVAVFGYVREAALAARFGVSATMDAYFGAIFIPNILYLILIAGTLSTVFIPILLHDDAPDEPAKISQTFSTVANFVLLLFVVVVCCGVVTAHAWLPLLFSGFATPTAQMALRLMYIIFPAVLFLALAGIFTAVLNGFHKFALAAFAPILSSVSVIAAALLAPGDKAIYWVAAATAAGFLLQALLLIPPIASLGIRYQLTLDLRHPAIIKLVRVGTPLFLYLVVANASAFLERNLASQISAGAVSTVTYATRLFAVPANFLAAPLAIVAYPRFAREALRPMQGELCSHISQMFRLVFFIFLPVTIWTMLNALPLTRLLYEHGQFRPENSIVTARVLTLYSIGILPNALAVIMLRCFYAIQDTLTPLCVELIDLAFYAVVATLLSKRLGVPGLAMTRAGAFLLVASLLLFVLRTQKRLLSVDFDLMRFITRTAFASLVMGAVSWLSLHVVQSAFDSGGTLMRMVVVGVVLLLSGATFLGVARLLKLREAMHILEILLHLVPANYSAYGDRE